MILNELLGIVFPAGQPIQPTAEQLSILHHTGGPGWVLAGPGSGKTEVLTLLVLRLLFVDADPIQASRVQPEEIFVTTFTDKAARNLEDRISHYRARIVAARPDLGSVDISKLRVGTLHGLCNDLLQEQRAPNYQNVRLMDELEANMFVYEHVSIIDKPDPARDRPFWTFFSYLFSAREWQPTRPHPPSKWNMTAALVKLFNRIAEDRISVPALRAAGGQWQRLAALYDEYRNHLQQQHRCDFSHLQLLFLEFLQSPLGLQLRDGNASEGVNGIRWVLVDEYQDTNLVQEEIYLTIAHRDGCNIVVVGDDDQALYRFRGGSVECMVSFDAACAVFLSLAPSTVQRYPLVANFRSHPKIVAFCNDYITAFPAMAKPGARVPNKPPLAARSAISGNYHAVGQLRALNVDGLATMFAETIHDLHANHVVQDYSQCCLLLRSTKETPNNAAKYVNALRSKGIPVYNPRNKAFLEQEEVLALLGSLIAITDPQGQQFPAMPQDLNELLVTCQAEFNRIASPNSTLAAWVARAKQNLAKHPGEYLTATLQELVYYVLALPPFREWAEDPARRIRLARITALIESFASMPVPGHPNVSRGTLKASATNLGGVQEIWSRQFYHLFFGYLSRVGLDEEEDDDVITPLGMVPIMTMHQAKGLQFPFVFVGHMGVGADISISHQLETRLSPFPSNPARSFTRLPEQDRADLDLIRQYYVAYSRAQYALILVGTSGQFAKERIPCGPNANWLPTRVLPL